MLVLLFRDLAMAGKLKLKRSTKYKFIPKHKMWILDFPSAIAKTFLAAVLLDFEESVQGIKKVFA